MSSKITLKNNIDSELSITHADGEGAISITSKQLKNSSYTVDTVAAMEALTPTDGQSCIVTDLDRGGIFVYDSTLVASDNQGTNFSGWIRQYSGAVNVKWFDIDNTGAISSHIALQKLADSLVDCDTVDFGDGIISSSVQIAFTTSNIKLIGKCEIKATASISGGLFNFTDIDSIEVRGITFTVDAAYNCVLLYFRPNVDLENITIEDCAFNFSNWNAIYHAGAGFAISNFIVSRCNFYGTGTAEAIMYEFGSLAFSRGYNPCIVNKCYFDNCLTSLRTSGSGLIKDTRFTDNKVYNSTGSPIFIYHSVDSFISGNTFDTYVDAAWFEQKCIITNNLFRNSENDGVILYNADKVFNGNSVYKSSGNGLVLSVELRNCLIEGNNIYENDGNGIRVSAEPRGDTWTGSSRIYDIDLKSNLIKSNGLNGVYLDDIQKDGITFGNVIEQVTFTNNSIERNGTIDEALVTPLNDACGVLHKEFGPSTGSTEYNFIGNKISYSTSATGVQGNQYNAIYINDNTSGVEKNINVNGNTLKANVLGIAFKNNKTYGVKHITSNNVTGTIAPSFSGTVTVFGNTYSDRTFTSESAFIGITIGYDTAAPTSGTYTAGSIVYDRTPAAGANIGWVCTTAGTPGTWKTFGTIGA